MRTSVLGQLVWVFLLACSSPSPGQSGGGSTCSGDTVDAHGRCLQLCDEGTLCVGETACVSGVCVDAPVGTACTTDDTCGVGYYCAVQGSCDVGQRPHVTLVSPASASIIGTQTPLVLRFDQSMDTASLSLSGSMAQGATPTWSTSLAANDTLELAPQAQWGSGDGSLIVDATSAQSVPLETLALSYSVDATLASVDATPPSGANLPASATITVRFSKSMQPGTLSLDGDMGSEASPLWQSDTRDNDTLLISPLIAWQDGLARSLLVSAIDVAGNPSAVLELSYNVDSTTPNASVTPPSGTRIGASTPITIVFDKSMSTASLVLGGALASWAQVAWQNGAALNDTVVVSPVASWPEGSSVDLSVDGADTFGNAMATLSLSYNVDIQSPYGSESPPSGGFITSSVPVTILFSESMDPGSLVLSGTLSTDVATTSWSNMTNTNDTLVISPNLGGWTLPGDLRIAANDLVGNPLATMVLSYQPQGSLQIAMVPVHAFKVANDDGTKACSITPAQVAQWLAYANVVYAPAGLHFEFDPDAAGPDWSEINSTLINQMAGVGDAQWTQERDAANAAAASVPNKLAVFFRYGPGSGATGGGFSWTDYQFVAMPGFNNTGLCGHQNIHLMAHEMGHQLGLAHTHAGSYATVADAATAYINSGHNADIFDGDKLLSTPPDPLVGATNGCLKSTYSVTLDGVRFFLPRDNVMSYYDSDQMTLSPDQVFPVRQGALLRTGQSVQQLLSGIVQAPIEGESLVAGASATAGSVSQQSNMRTTFLGRWSGDAQLFWGGAAVGEALTLSFNVQATGVYRLYAVFTKAPDFGMFGFSVNEQPQTPAIDLYARRVTLGSPVDLGVYSMAAGTNVLRVQVEGTNPDSFPTRYYFGLDYLLLQTAD